jgi:hypothetical protein
MDLCLKTDEEVLRVATPIMDNLMDGSNDIDWEQYMRDSNQRAKQILAPAEFKRQCKEFHAKYGFFAERELVRVFRRSESILITWKQKVTKSGDELIALLELVQEGSRFLVTRTLVT